MSAHICQPLLGANQKLEIEDFQAQGSQAWPPRHVHESSQIVGGDSKETTVGYCQTTAPFSFQKYNATLFDSAIYLPAADFASLEFASKSRWRPAEHTACLPPRAGDFHLGVQICHPSYILPVYSPFDVKGTGRVLRYQKREDERRSLVSREIAMPDLASHD